MLLATITFDWTISLGQIVNAVLIVLGAIIGAIKLWYSIDKRFTALATAVDNRVTDLGNAVDKRVSMLEADLVDHTKTLADHAVRMQRWEETLFKIVGDLQRVIGRMEVWDGQTERRSKGRSN